MKYVVCVTFQVKNEFRKEFMPIVCANARTSLNNEEGCLLFDVCSNSTTPEEVFLYEVYTSEYAFEAHLKSEHFLLFNAKVAHMVLEKEVKTYSMVG